MLRFDSRDGGRDRARFVSDIDRMWGTVAMRIEADEGQSRLYLAQDRERLELPALWLRERSADPEQCDPLTHQRLYDPHQLRPE